MSTRSSATATATATDISSTTTTEADTLSSAPHRPPPHPRQRLHGGRGDESLPDPVSYAGPSRRQSIPCGESDDPARSAYVDEILAKIRGKAAAAAEAAADTVPEATSMAAAAS
jgi:hypothetical protein